MKSRNLTLLTVMTFRSTRTYFLFAFVVLGLCVGAFAQGGIGELTGEVTDSTGAVVPGVAVKLTNTATGEVRTTVTTPSGTYRFPALPIVGTYTLEVAAKGFKPVKVENIIASVGIITARDVKLEVGAVTEQVTVEAGGQLVETEDSSLSQNVDRHVWQEMPLETRSQNEFIGLLAGAEPAALAELNEDRGAAVNGARSGSGNFMVDGFDNNDQGLGGAYSTAGGGPGGALTTISPDAIEEYRVIEGTPPAEYGKAGGFVTDTVLRSGTNSWHGSLFEYNRIQALTANSWFSNHSDEQDHLVRNQFGGSIGGPIVKDKTFFYFTVEAHRMRRSYPTTGATITPDFINFVQSGNFETFIESSPNGMCNNQAFLNSLVTSGYLSSAPSAAPCKGAFAANATTGAVFQKMIAAQPLPLCAAGAANCTNLTNGAQGLWTGGGAGALGLKYPVNVYGTVTLPQVYLLNQMRYATKVDHKVGSNDQINAAYLYDNPDFNYSATFGPASPSHNRAQNAGVTWSHTFSATVLNQARMSYVRHTSNFPGDPSVTGMPYTWTWFDEPITTFGNADNIPQFFTENEFIYKDDLSVTKGKHNFKGGAEYRRTRNGSSFDEDKYGENISMDWEDVLTDETFTNNVENHFFGGPVYGSMYQAYASLNPQTGAWPNFYRGYRANEVAMYIQDDWRIHPRLTVNLGVRWEYFGPPHNFQSGIDANLYTGVALPFANPCVPVSAGGTCTSTPNPFLPTNSPYYGSFATGVVEQRNHDLWNKDLDNFGPRLGFAYDALGNQKVVVRGGFGINYDRLYNNIFENIRFNPPFFAIGELGYYSPSQVPVTNSVAAPLVTYPFTGTSSYLNYRLAPSIRAMDQNLVTPYYEQAHLGVQYQLGRDFVWESNYVGTFGHKLIGVLGRNIYDGEYVGGGYATSPINPNYGNINFRTNCCDSNYHALQTTLRKRFSSGLQFNANYTFSKAMDDISDAFYTKNGSINYYPTDSENPHFDYGPADFNVKHRIVASFVYDLPFARSNRWIGGWNVSGIVSWQTGADFSVNDSSVDSNGDGQFNDRANYIGPGSIKSDINHSHEPWQGYLNDPNGTYWGMLNAPSSTATRIAIPCPATVNMGLWCEGQALGQMERNTLVGPAFFNTDFGIKKTFKITEKSSFRLEGNFFNLFNHPNFYAPDGNLNDGTFGMSLSTFPQRVTQLAARFDF